MKRIAIIHNPISENFMVIEQMGPFQMRILFARQTLFHAVADANVWLRRN